MLSTKDGRVLGQLSQRSVPGLVKHEDLLHTGSLSTVPSTQVFAKSQIKTLCVSASSTFFLKCYRIVILNSTQFVLFMTLNLANKYILVNIN